MPDNIDLDSKGSEINLNLKIPQEDTESVFSFKDLVHLIYNARKIFLIWTCVGVTLGIIAAALIFFYARPRDEVSPDDSSEVSMYVILNYSKPSENIFPDGKDFDESSLYLASIWENALAKIGRDDITAADAMSCVKINNMPHTDSFSELADAVNKIPPNIPANMYPTILQGYLEDNFMPAAAGNTYILKIPAGSSVFNSIKEKENFLAAYGEEYKEYIDTRFYSNATIGALAGQYLGAWTKLTDEAILWDTFDFSVNFNLISDRYLSLISILESIHWQDPAYVSGEGKRFDEYADELNAIVAVDLAQWEALLDSRIYIQNIDRFADDFDTVISIKRTNHQYYADLINFYNDALYSYRQASTGMTEGNEKSYELFAYVQEMSELAAGINREINRMQAQYEELTENASAVRSRSRQAEAALAGFVSDLHSRQEKLYDVIYEYYKQKNDSESVEAVLVSKPAVTNVSVSEGSERIGRTQIILMGLAFVVCSAAGIMMAFLIVAVKKHLPEDR